MAPATTDSATAMMVETSEATGDVYVASASYGIQRLRADDPRVLPPPAGSAPDLNRPLLAVCEGRDSATRDALGADWLKHGYGHQAIAARLVADVPHRGVARQWFRSPDILALLPFDRPEPTRSCALVWSLPDAMVAERLALDDAAFDRPEQAEREVRAELATALRFEPFPEHLLPLMVALFLAADRRFKVVVALLVAVPLQEPLEHAPD